MKKLLFLITIIFFSFTSFSQERELSDYEKYRLEQEAKDRPDTQEEVFYIVEDMPKFKGENAKFFRTWIAKHVMYPSEASTNGIEGKVIVSFVVNRYGDVVNAVITQSVDPYLDAEAIRVVESSPKWKPGKQRGEAVNVQFTFPIQFILDEVAEEPVVVNNYYVQSDFRHSLYFGYSWNYRPYGYPSYGAWYGGYYDYYAYYGMYYPYYGYNYYPYYSYNYWGYYPYSTNYYSSRNRKYANNSFGRNYSNTYNYKTYRSGNVNTATPYRTSKSAVSPQSRTQTVQKSAVRPQTQTTRQNQTMNKTQVRNDYKPNYRKPAPNQRSQYNRQSSTTVRKSSANRTQSQQRSSTYQRPVQKSSTYSRPASTPTRNQSSYQRSSGVSRSSGSVSRSSSSYSRSSGTRSSGSSGSSSSRSSGSSRSSRR